MRRGFLCGLGAAVLTIGLAATSLASAEPEIPCGPVSATTLASDGLARVYSQHGWVYGCAAAGQKSFLLGQASGTYAAKRVGPIALAGVDAAYGLTTSGVDTISSEVVVRRLTDGQVLRSHNAITGNLPAEFYERVDVVVVKANGSVAWTANAGSIISHTGLKVQVEKSDQTSRTLLDQRPDINTGSLRLNGSTLTWRDGASRRSATLR
jgi:hypothetical protein